MSWRRTDRRSAELRAYVRAFNQVTGQTLRSRRTYADLYFRNVEFERLEFLGDAINNLVIMEDLLAGTDATFTREHRRHIAERYQRMMSDAGLARIAFARDVADFLDKDPQKPQDLADGVEAVVGAVWLDRGEDAARSVVGRMVLGHAPRRVMVNQLQDDTDDEERYSFWLTRMLGYVAFKAVAVDLVFRTDAGDESALTQRFTHDFGGKARVSAGVRRLGWERPMGEHQTTEFLHRFNAHVGDAYVRGGLLAVRTLVTAWFPGDS